MIDGRTKENWIFSVLVISDLPLQQRKLSWIWPSGFWLLMDRDHLIYPLEEFSSIAKPPDIKANWYFFVSFWKQIHPWWWEGCFALFTLVPLVQYGVFCLFVFHRFKMIWKQKWTRFQHYFINYRRLTDNCSVLLNGKQIRRLSMRIPSAMKELVSLKNRWIL